MDQTIESKNKALVLEAFDTRFNKRNYETAGVAVVNCSPYIKEWMLRERGEEANTK